MLSLIIGKAWWRFL